MTTFCIPASVITGPVSKSALAGGFEAASVLLAKDHDLLDGRCNAGFRSQAERHCRSTSRSCDDADSGKSGKSE
jgi:hypothetical protein